MDTVLGVLCPAESGGVSCCELFCSTVDRNSLSVPPCVISEHISAASFHLGTFLLSPLKDSKGKNASMSHSGFPQGAAFPKASIHFHGLPC